MAEPKKSPRVKFLCGMISARKELFAQAIEPLTELLGPVDLVGPIMDFDLTDYYNADMGQPLLRQFVAFEQLRPADELAAVKLATNAIEKQFAERAATAAGGPRRPINLDPGYIEPAKLVLASMKNFSHRIYLGQGVYGEVTLMYHKTGRWNAQDWTFPDYASPRYHSFLSDVRTRLREQLEQEARP